MVIGYYVLQFIISYLATMLFSVIFNAPRRLLLACGFVGAMGWIIYKVTFDLELGKVMASFLGSFILAIMSHTMSRSYKRPVIIFIVPWIISLVLGGLADETKRFVVRNQDTHVVITFLEVTLIAGAIAFVILCAEIIYYIYTRIKQQYGKMHGKIYKKSYNMNNRA